MKIDFKSEIDYLNPALVTWLCQRLLDVTWLCQRLLDVTSEVRTHRVLYSLLSGHYSMGHKFLN